jgi:hypothetical protein
LFSKYQISKLNFRKSGFVWGHAIPKLGKYMDNTKVGKKLADRLQSLFGAMWMIKFIKTELK